MSDDPASLLAEWKKAESAAWEADTFQAGGIEQDHPLILRCKVLADKLAILGVEVSSDFSGDK